MGERARPASACAATAASTRAATAELLDLAPALALLHAGSSVLCGAGSTMCGFVALAFAQTHTFQVFFRMTFATVALALLHALLVFPALLAWFGPSEKEE